MKKLTDTLNEKEKKNLNLTECEENRILFRENTLCTSVGIVLKGEAVIVSYTSRGNEILYKNLKEGDLFGNHLLFSSSPVYQGNILTKTRCTFALLSKEAFLGLLERNPAFLRAYLESTADQTKQLNEQIKLLSIADAEERFLYYLQIHRNQAEYASLSDLAERLSLRRETLSRVIARLSEKGEIERKKRLIVKR